MSSKIAVNLISGALGSGKTTLVRHLLEQKPPSEKWALLVNEFGAVGIDGAIFSEHTEVSSFQIPGGCICCTAKTELKAALLNIAHTEKPDRLIIEPTGLGEPDTIIDLFTSAECTELFQVDTLISVFDINNTDIEELESKLIFQSLLNMADVIVLNKTDLASPAETEALSAYCQTLFPPKRAILSTQNAIIPLETLYFRHFSTEPNYRFSLTPEKPSLSPSLVQPSSHDRKTFPYDPIQLPNLVKCVYRNDLNTQAIGWVFDPSLIFDWKMIFTTFESFRLNPNILRAKGIFRVGNPRMLFQYVHGEATREIIAYRKDSRVEILLSADSSSRVFDFNAFEQQLLQAIK